MGHSMSNGPTDFDKTFPDERYIWDKIILKISAQTDNPFKNYEPQSWPGKLKIDKIRWVRQLGCNFKSQ